ncbi:SWR1-complex protein [Paracoccidioides lutzii Pb01]|uniref:SWR1-complex protein 5 n=1 Tax=Paracoccidioides lutzii (strain ATCC MYA-826 / Pb01) TaxID=502779 RepID=C1H3C4_PARBA|nr:SWR1-complex protein [Paracoccidioides lutzii Pb01]EEH34218.1 SWR1-complex protein [Paracoccidioides lutzii Pb01]
MAPPAIPTVTQGGGMAVTPGDAQNAMRVSTTGGEYELEEEEEEYNSDEDTDFDANAPAADDDEDEDREGGEINWGADRDRPSKRRKLSPGADDGDLVMDAGFDSGDEITIRAGKEMMEKVRRRKEIEKKTGKKGKSITERDSYEDDADEFEIDDDDMGGFVRTRGMKMRMHEEQRPLARADGATVDVDALWEQMKTVGPSPIPPKPIGQEPSGGMTSERDKQNDRSTTRKSLRQMLDQAHPSSKTPQIPPSEETVTIKRVYKFAGEVVTENKTVPKDSAEAKLYLYEENARKNKQSRSSKGAEKDNDPSDGGNIPLRRPLRKYSRFDPNTPDLVKKSWEKNVVAPNGAGVGGGEQPKGPKLNTVMKSQLDWAKYVDRTGIKDELDVHSKAKEGYLSRMDFLNRVYAKREEERRNARLKNL